MLRILGGGNDTIVLRNREETVAGPYITLSHCWGGNNTALLTSESEGAFRNGVKICALPKTFQDAIKITVMLGANYLWIDSLCIFQDRITDWNIEAAAMRDVYSRAVCNISATAAPNGSVGLFSERDALAHTPFRLMTNWTIQTSDVMIGTSEQDCLPAGFYEVSVKDEFNAHVEYAPLNRRAWVMQERFLSKRTLHFASSQVFWECLENTASETFPNVLPLYLKPTGSTDSQGLKRVYSREKRDDTWLRDLYEAWTTFIESYSRCGLSKPADKLVAINGIRQIIEESTGSRVIAGLWESRLLQELCWQRRYDRNFSTSRLLRPVQWRAPSWSWARFDASIRQSNIWVHQDCPNLKPRSYVETVDVTESNAGQLNKASLTLRGKLVNATETALLDENGLRESKVTLAINGMTLESTLDDPIMGLEVDEELFCLAVYECGKGCSMYRSNGPIWNMPPYMYGLVLRNVSAAPEVFERVGVFELDYSIFEKYVVLELTEDQAVVLI
jgi:hypothetical protein